MSKKHERFVNGYKMIYKPEHRDAVKSGSMEGYIYEHRLVAEESIGRLLRSEEDVHHLDENRLNNLPRNLLVLERSQHQKLHNWLSQHTIIPIENTKAHRELQLNYCNCGKQIEADAKYCSQLCCSVATSKLANMDNEELRKEIWILPTSTLANKYNVSDKALEKHCRKYNIEKPPRGYWQKLEEGYLISRIDF